MFSGKDSKGEKSNVKAGKGKKEPEPAGKKGKKEEMNKKEAEKEKKDEEKPEKAERFKYDMIDEHKVCPRHNTAQNLFGFVRSAN